MGVIEYRILHPRCRTCQHAKDFGLFWDFWTCKVKNTRHKGQLGKTLYRGMFCPVYLAKEAENHD